MRSGIFYGLAVLATALSANPVISQTDSAEKSDNRVAVHKDWSVFEETSPIEYCWSASQPKESVHTRGGEVVSVRRGDILLLISFIPEKNVSGGVSFRSGYPFREGAEVSVDIDGKKFSLFTQGEMAWTSSDEEDGKLVEALKLGNEAVIVGVSSRGTTTKDTFSLMGVTAAIEDAKARC